MCTSPPWLGWPLWNICVIKDHGYVPLVINTSWAILHSWLITRFVTRLTRRVPLMEQELLTLQKHLSSPSVFSGVHVTRSLVLFACFCRSLFVLLSFFCIMDRQLHVCINLHDIYDLSIQFAIGDCLDHQIFYLKLYFII